MCDRAETHLDLKNTLLFCLSSDKSTGEAKPKLRVAQATLPSLWFPMIYTTIKNGRRAIILYKRELRVCNALPPPTQVSYYRNNAKATIGLLLTTYKVSNKSYCRSPSPESVTSSQHTFKTHKRNGAVSPRLRTYAGGIRPTYLPTVDTHSRHVQ